MIREQDLQDFYTRAVELRVHPGIYAIDTGNRHLLSSPLLWPAISERECGSGYSDDAAMLVYMDGMYDDVLSVFSEEVSRCKQFPVASVYLTGLGVVASCMVKGFQLEYHYEHIPANLYIAVAQPASTGKSAVLKALSNQARISHNDLCKENSVKRRSIEIDLADCEKRLKSEKASANVEPIIREMDALTEELSKYPIYEYGLDDATPESIDESLPRTGNVFTIVSAESTALTTVLGANYGADGSSRNNNIFLKGWAGEWVLSKRVGRTGASGLVRGSMVVLAQDKAVNALLRAGLSGEGVSERVLILRERHMLGRRTHTPKFQRESEESKSRYNEMIDAVVNTSGVILRIPEPVREMMIPTIQGLESGLKDDGRFSHEMLRGVIGKADIQICKLACVIHVIDEWSPGGGRSEVVSESAVKRAISVYSGLKETYIEATDSQGFVGVNTSADAVIKRLKGYAAKNKLQITINQLRSAIKNDPSIAGTVGLTDQLRKHWLPHLEGLNYCLVNENDIYINPKVLA